MNVDKELARLMRELQAPINPEDLDEVVAETAVGPVSMTKEAKYRPAASLTTVTDEGTDGRSRDHRTRTSPIFGRRSFPPAVMDKRALRVKRIACRLSLLDRNRGGATFGPLRFPDTEAKKVR